MTTRPRDAEATRLRLLRAAQRRFVLFGYDRTTTREIAGDADVNISLINRYFGGKEGLYQAVVEASGELLDDADRLSGDLVADFLTSMDASAWPDLGAHPMLLLLRDDGVEPATRKLRGDVLRKVSARLAEQAGGGEDAELRAQLALAFLHGVVALRASAALEPLASADEAALEPAIRDAITALLGG